MIRRRAEQTLWLPQEAYIDKLANTFGLADYPRAPDTPMITAKLCPGSVKTADASRHRYQRRIGGILFTAITTKLDIASTASRLSRCNQNPEEEHHKAVGRVLPYLYNTKGRATTPRDEHCGTGTGEE